MMTDSSASDVMSMDLVPQMCGVVTARRNDSGVGMSSVQR